MWLHGGGIRYSSTNNAIAVFLCKSSTYQKEIKGDKLEYMGSGKGNQDPNMGRNARITNAKKNNSSIFVFEMVDGVNCRYLGQFEPYKEPSIVKIKNKYGEEESKIIFHLKR